MKKSALIYEEFYCGVQELPPEMKAEAYDAYCRWVMYDEEYTGNNIAIKVLLASVSQKVHKANAEYDKKAQDISDARSEAGKKGAAAKWGKSAKANDSKASQLMANDDKNATVTVTDSVTDSVSVNDSDTGSSSKTEDLMFSDENIRRTDVQRVVDAWNFLPAPVPKIQKLVAGSPRDKNLKTKIKQYGIDNVLKAIDNIRESPFLLGQKTDFLIRFEWFVKPTNFPKVLDGVYEDHESPQRQQRGRDAPFDPTAYLLDEIEQEGG